MWTCLVPKFSWFILIFIVMVQCIPKSRTSRQPLKSSQQGDEQAYTHYERIKITCEKCLEKSYQRYKNDGKGRDREGSWIDSNELQIVLDLLQSMRISSDSKVIQFMQSSKLPIFATLYQSNAFDITLMHAPQYKLFSSRTHNPGTVLIYRSIYGKGYMRTHIRTREINYEVMENNVLTRMGGTSKVFGSTEEGPATLLELALHPPRLFDEGFDSDHCFDTEEDVLKINIHDADISPMFSK